MLPPSFFAFTVREMHLTVTGGAMALLTFHLGVYESTCNSIWPISTDNINIFSIETLIYMLIFALSRDPHFFELSTSILALMPL